MSQVLTERDPRALSKYFKRFEKLAATTETVNIPLIEGGIRSEIRRVESSMSLKGDMMLVEKLPSIEKKTKSGIIIADHKGYKENFSDGVAQFGIVIMVGPGQLLEDGTVVAPDSKPGDVILLPHNVDWYTQFGHLEGYEPGTLGRVRDSQVSLWFTDYKRTFEVLNNEEI